MSNPSRFDTRVLLSANSGEWFCTQLSKHCGQTRYSAEITDLDSFNQSGRKIREGTKAILLLGERSQREVGGANTSLGENRGCPLFFNGIPCVSSYLPIDTHDMVDHERRLNPHLKNRGMSETGEQLEGESEDDDGGDSDVKTRHGRTSRGNYRFWLERDLEKVGRVLKTGGFRVHSTPDYRIFPSAEEAITELSTHKDEDFFLDIETDSDLNITCFGFTFGANNPVFTVPLLRYDYSTAYSATGQILRALCKAMARNNTVAHNGSSFDFFVIPYRYGIPVGVRLSDTLLMQHRAFPEIEKSLGHVISLYTDLPYHKDEGVFEPRNTQQEQSLWSYNAKDVYAMREVYYSMREYAVNIKGLTESWQQVNDSIYPYLTATLQGIAYDEEMVVCNLKDNDRSMNGLLRLLTAAVGKERLEEIRGSGSSDMPTSSTQCCRYFHDMCGYPIQGYGKVQKRGKYEGKRAPSLNEKNFLKLVMKMADKGVVNPVIDIVLAYRGIAKESSMLKFEPWCGIRKLKN